LMQLASVTFNGEKKKADFIIPASYFQQKEKAPKQEEKAVIVETITVENPVIQTPKIEIAAPTLGANPLSISGLRKLKEIQQANEKLQSERQNIFLEEPFTESDMLLYWTKYKDRLDAKGFKIISSIMGMSEPKLEGTTIHFEVPNESSKIDLESEFPELLGYLKGHLKNHTITIKVVVNETIQVKRAFTPEEKYRQMIEKNPALELLRKTFDLEI
jgi:DNA polymerase-3 subunit gamma/tau